MDNVNEANDWMNRLDGDIISESNVLNNRASLDSLVDRIAGRIVNKKIGKTGTIKDIKDIETELFNQSDFTGNLNSQDLKKLGKMVLKILPKAISKNESINEASEDVLSKLKNIVKDHQRQKIGGQMVDASTANVILQVYNALKPESQKKFIKTPIKKMAEFAWSMAK